MTETANLGLPLLAEAQAQKHVTVNEALVRLDAVGQLRLLSVTQTLPPAVAADGDCYGVPFGAVNAWSGQEGRVAVWSNGGWLFLTPSLGWRGWVADVAAVAVFDGSDWVVGAVALSPNGAATRQDILEVDHVIAAGNSSSLVGAIPAHSMVIGVTGRVSGTISGTLTGWRLGVAGADNRYGSGLGLNVGSWVRGLTGAPVTYYADTDLLLSAEAGDFAGGSVRLCVHLLQLDLPNL
ncbi:MAG: DUF2793 domain-containing protein [Paracoccaceae bacterium]|nr:DUF2793 domain-containing protein [Paracoccaceae bacterium]